MVLKFCLEREEGENMIIKSIYDWLVSGGLIIWWIRDLFYF